MRLLRSCGVEWTPRRRLTEPARANFPCAGLFASRVQVAPVMLQGCWMPWLLCLSRCSSDARAYCWSAGIFVSLVLLVPFME